MGLDDMLQALLEQVDEIYNKTKSGELTSVEDINENVVGIEQTDDNNFFFYIMAEPSVEPNAYNYVTNDLNIRLSKIDLINQTVIYKGEVGIYYKELGNYKPGDSIKTSIINNISVLEDVKDMGKGTR